MHSKYRPTEKDLYHKKHGYLQEECGELSQALGKALRWGLDSVNPELPEQDQETNREWIIREMQDVKYAIQLLEKALEDGEGFYGNFPNA